MAWGELAQILKSTASRWNSHNAPRLGAALAYYSLLSIAPLLILVIAICGLVFTKSTAQQDVLQQVERLAGSSSAQTLQAVIANAHRSGSGVAASVIAVVTLFFGASGIFVELRASLNTIWDAPPPDSSGWRDMVRQRLVSFGMVLALGFFLLVSTLVSAAIAIMENFFGGLVPLHFAVLSEIANSVISLLAIAVLFGLIFKFVPNVPIRWRDVGVGALVTAILFDVGKALLGLYLGTAAVGSTYGAAGSLVALIVWVYYSAQIFFFGAEFTRVYADRLGSPTSKRQRVEARKSAAGAAN
jgi:membrane protein